MLIKRRWRLMTLLVVDHFALAMVIWVATLSIYTTTIRRPLTPKGQLA